MEKKSINYLFVFILLVGIFSIISCNNPNKSAQFNEELVYVAPQKENGEVITRAKNNQQKHSVLTKTANVKTKIVGCTLSGKYTAYLASPARGIIGLYNGVTTDNPADNIFSITIDRELTAADRVWLNYKMKGISHHSGVSCSVNDRYAFGGYTVKTDTATQRQRVELHPAWLKKGQNQIRFGLAEGVNAGCLITDLALEIEQGSASMETLAIDADRSLYNGSAYIHGFVREGKTHSVKAGGENLALRDNEFEALLKPDADSIIVEAKVDGKSFRKVIKYVRNQMADYTLQPEKTGIENVKLFSTNSAGKLGSGLALLKAPEKAVITSRKLSVADLRTIDLPALDMGMTNVTAENRGVRFLPHGQHFGGEGATVALKYDRTRIPDGFTENDIRTYYFDPATKHWVALERDTVDKTLCMVVSKTTHFTDMINGVITTPESPETQGFAPTMMNDIKAADPTSKIELIAPPTANNQGSANLSYPIELPPARNGMSPQLAITYNSDGGSGWLGEGWDLQIPSITVDTRWGVPRYDPRYETETYNYNGVMLATVVDTTSNDSLGIASVGHKGVLYQRLTGLNSEGVQFHPVTESDFSRITRLGSSPESYYWKVITKNGLTIIYGDKNKNATLEGTANSFIYENTNSTKKIKESKNVIAEWKISSIEDQYGNFCHYYYDCRNYSIHESDVKAKSLRLNKIQIGRYKKPNTNHSDTIYQIIDFVASTPKSKFFTNARYGFLTASDSLMLNNINIKIKNPDGTVVPVNGYSFVYKYGEFNSMLLDSISQLDNEGVIKVSHKLSYYDNIQNNDYYHNEQTINTASVEKNDVNNSIPATESGIPALGGAKSTSSSGSFYVGIGADFLKVASAELGYNHSNSSSKSESIMLMVDINGDGLPDKIYKGIYNNAERLCFIPNLGNNQFATSGIVIEGYSGNFSFSKTTSYTNGWSGNVGVKLTNNAKASINVGMDWLNSESTTDTYLSDVNSDGLIDIVSNGVVYFNSISHYQSNVAIPSFSTNSGVTPRPVLNIKTPRKKAGELKISDNFVSLPAPSQPEILTMEEPSDSPIQRDSGIVMTEKLDFYDQIPMQDIVSVWEAPRPGYISINNIIKFLGNNIVYGIDGVRLAIQTNGDEIWNDSIKPSNLNPDTAVTLNNIEVVEGQKVYFRLQSGSSLFSDNLEDVVLWRKNIFYQNYFGGYTTDMEGNEYESYNSVEGSFVSQQFDNVIDSVYSYIDVIGKFSKPQTTDSVFLKLYVSTDSLLYRDSIVTELKVDSLTGLIDTSHVKYRVGFPNNDYYPEELFWETKFGKQEINLGELAIDSIPGFECPMHIRFEISSNTNIKWNEIIWKPELRYTHSGTKNDTILYAGIKYKVFEKKYQAGEGNIQETVTNNNNPPYFNVPIIPQISINSERQISTNYTLVLFKRNYNTQIPYCTFLTEHVATFYGRIENNISVSNFSISTLGQGKYFFSLYINDTINSSLVSASCTLQNCNFQDEFTPYIYCLQAPSRTLFGHMWRGWGQFQYNAANGRYAKPIEEDSLFMPNDTSKQYLADKLRLQKMCMFSMNHKPYKNSDYWIGSNDHLLIKGDTMCTGRLNLVEMPLILSPGYDESTYTNTPNYVRRKSNASSGGLTGTKFEINNAPVLSNKSTATTSWGGASAQFGVYNTGISGSKSNGETNITSSFMDMNGDGFPDYITDTQIEFTNPKGGRDGEITNIISEKNSNNSLSYGFSGGNTAALSSKFQSSVSVSNPHDIHNISLTVNLSKIMDVSASGGFNYSKNTNNSVSTLSYIDLNGDGLPDRMYIRNNKVYVCINQGYCFSDSIDWGLSRISLSRSISNSIGASLGGNYWKDLTDIFADKGGSNLLKRLTDLNLGINFGINAVKTTTYNLYGLFDINADGLPDKIYKNENEQIVVEFNTGSDFTPALTLSEIEELNKALTTATSANLSINIALKFGWFKIALGGSGSLSWATDYTLNQMMDIDGDGYPDVVKANNITGHLAELNVKRSLIGTTNKLKSVTNPLGGVFRIDYKRSDASYDHPGGKWVMSSVMVNDGITDDGDSLKNHFSYDGGKYDRYEREFLGFGKVTTENINTASPTLTTYRKLIQTFDNSNYYTRGALLTDTLKLMDGNIEKTYSESVNKYRPYSVSRMAHNSNADKLGKYVLKTMNTDTDFSHDKLFLNQYIVYAPAKYSMNKVYAYDNGSASSLITSESYYDFYTAAGTHGEVSMYKYSDKGNLGENGTGSFNYKTEITYLRNKPTMTLFSLPVSYTVKDENGFLYRKTEAEWNDDFATQLKKVKQFIGNGDTAIVTIGYDRWGNMCQKELPGKTAAERMWYKYEYDNHYHLFPVKVSDKFGYTSTMSNYNYKFGIPLKTTDFTGSVSTTTLDNLGRVVTITGPNEYDAGNPAKHTIKFQYYPDKVTKNTDGTINNPAYAVTRHYDPTHPADSIVTVTFVDGFGRAVQVKKDAVVDGAAKMIVSGRVKYDAFGRPVRSYYPMVDELSNSTVFKRDSDAYKTLTSYDVLDRVTQTILPDNSRTKMEYAIVNGLLRTRVTDANNKYQDTYATGDGKTVKTVQYRTFTNNVGSDPLTTLFEYDAINQPVKVTDDAGKTTVSVYDLAGRRTKVTHPASGETRFRYDVAGNMISKKTANLLLTGDSILYVYNFNRLTEIKYPDHPENNVKYVYGAANDEVETRRGRLKYLEDGSGGQEFSYGKQGELTQVRRTLVIPNQAVATYVTQWQYDSWNRLLNMTYPDGEVVNYTYNTGGMLTGVASTANTYVSNIKYDKFEQRTQLTYGNGAVTNYTYKPENRLLNTLSVVSNNTTLMNNTYTYDAVNNVTKIANTGAVVNTTTGTIGGSITHNYFYDNLYRLDSANGEFIAGAKKANYGLRMRYDNMHNIVYKKQDIVQKGVQFTGALNAGYELFYTINTNNSQQIANIADASYRVDRGTNGTYQLGKQTGDEVTVRAEDYTYDANGNLIYVLKGNRKPDSTLQVINSRKLLWDEENRLLSINDNGFVSNYWYDASGERTVKQSYDNEGVQVNGALSAARTGTGKYTAYISPYMVLNNGGNYTKHIYMGSQRIVSKWSNSSIFDTELPTDADAAMIKDFSKKYKLQTNIIKARFDTLGVNFNGRLYTGMLDNPEADALGHGTYMLPQKYFYHSDHLGSSSLITDITGAMVQHVEYVPFGETFLDERNGSWHTPYLFNAKEQDEETGLYYYGARYYDSKRSVWISSDPLKELYPNVSSYVYCHNNPIMYVDPDGRTDFNINGNIKTINDDYSNITVKVSERQFNKAQKKFAEGGSGYEKYLNKLFRKNETTEVRTRYYSGEGNPSGQIIGCEVDITISNSKNRRIDWDDAVKNAEDFMIVASMADGQLPFGDLFGLLRVSGTRLGKFLFGGAKAAEMLGNFGIPKYYTYVTKVGESVFVSPNAMKHLQELASNGAKLGSDYLKLLGQIYQKALHSAIDDVFSRGVVQYNKMYYSGGNEIMFGAPRTIGELPAVIHFR